MQRREYIPIPMTQPMGAREAYQQGFMPCYEHAYSAPRENKKPRAECAAVRGNSVDIALNQNDCEVRTDVTVTREHSVRIWGQVADCDGAPVGGALIKLIGVTYEPGGLCQYYGVAHTITDCEGFYQFDIPACDIGEHYKLLVGKAALGKERVIFCQEHCDPCRDNLCEQ